MRQSLTASWLVAALLAPLLACSAPEMTGPERPQTSELRPPLHPPRTTAEVFRSTLPSTLRVL